MNQTDQVNKRQAGEGSMMSKMKNRYMSMILSVMMCFSNSFTVIQAEEETIPEEPEVLETLEEQQEADEVPESEIISDPELTDNQETEETDAVEETLPEELFLEEETELNESEMNEVEEVELPQMTEEPQGELFADQEDTTWQNDFYYGLVGDHIQLNRLNASYSCYKGTAVDVTVPAHAVINGVTYTTELGERAFNNDKTIVNLTFEEGVLLPADCSFVLAGCNKLQTLDISHLDTSHVTSMYCMFNGNSVMTTLVFGDPNTSNVTKMNGMFGGCGSLPALDLSKLDTGNVTDMSSMFSGCRSLTTLDVSTLYTGKVTNMYSMFKGCSNLTTLDVSMLDTKNVTDMSYMFENCSSLTTLDVSTLNTSQVKNMSYMFNGCRSLQTLDVSHFDTRNATSMTYMFYGCGSLTALDVSGFQTGNVTSMYSMFNSCRSLKTLDVTGFDTKKVTDMPSMFSYCSSLTAIDVSHFDTSNVTRMSGMFGYCSSLTALDISMFNIEKVDSLYGLFQSCSSLTSLKINGINTSNVTNMSYMFSGCSSLTSVDLRGMDTSNVTNMSYMFNECSKLKEIDVSTLNTSKVTTMNSMFAWCSSLTELDVSRLDTGNVKDMIRMFANCGGLETITVNGMNTENVTSMANMFDCCSSLTALDVSRLNTSNVTSMYFMFSDCDALTTLDISMLDTSKVTNMSGMFYGDSALTELTINGINTSSVTNMSSMFYGCSAMPTLDISMLDTSKVTDISKMFQDCHNMEKLYLCDLDLSNVRYSDYVFRYLAKDIDAGGNLYLTASISELKNNQFYYSHLKNIYFCGTEEEWNVRVGNNDISTISNVKIHFNYVPGSEEDPDPQTDWEYSDITYTMIIQGTGDMADYAEEEAPWNDIRDNILIAVIGNDFESIGSCALQDTVHLQRVYIPASVTEIRDNAFSNTPELHDIYFAGTQEQWDAIEIGEGNASLSTENVHVQCLYDFSVSWEFDPETSTLMISGDGPMIDFKETSAPWYIFKDHVTTIVIDEGITVVGAYAFKDFTNLKKMSVPVSVTHFNAYALNQDEQLKDIYYPGSQEQWGKIVSGIGNEILFSETLTVHYDRPYEESIIMIKRNDAWYDALDVKQTYYYGSDEEAVLKIIPAAKYDNVGFIALKRGTETLNACSPADGMITFVPGKELSAGDVIKIVLCTMETETIEEYELAIEVIENRFTITYFYNDSSDDSGIYKTEEYRLGSEIRKPEDPVREGYVFDGWYTNQKCTGIGFFDPRHGLNSVNTDTALYAKWNKVGFDIEHDAWSFDNSGRYFYGDNYKNLSDKEQKNYHYEIADSYFEQLLSVIDNFFAKCMMRSRRKTKWQGSCFGMSAAALLAKMKYLSIKSFDPNAEDVGSANIYVNPVIDKDVGDIESLINYYTLLQYVKPLETAVEAHSDNESEDLKNIVEKMEKTGQPVLLNLDLIDDEGKVGHSVIAYDFEKKSDNEYSLSIYDCSKGNTRVYEVIINKDSSGIYTADYGEWVSAIGWLDNRILLYNAMTAEELASFGLLKKPGEIVRKNANGNAAEQTENTITLETGYSSFTITNGSGTATISNSTVLSDGIGGVVSHGQNNYQYGSDRFTFDLPILSEGDSYTIVPTDHEADNYMTIIGFGNNIDGFFVLVDADREGTITVDRYGKVTTSYDAETEQEIWVCSELMETPWYLIEIEGTSTGFTAEAVNGIVQSASAADVQVAVESDFNRYEISNVTVGTDGVQVVEGDNLTCEVLSGDEIIGGGTFGYSVVFDSSHGSSVETLLNVPAGSKIQKPENPVRDGYVFEGWYKEKTFETAWDFENDEVTNDLVLYAGWSVDKNYLVTVTFKIPEMDDAVVYLPKNTVLDAEKYPSSQDSLTLKWYTDAELTNEWNKTEAFTEDMILYAGEAEAVITDYGDVLAEDIPADGIIPEGIWTAGIKDKTYAGSAIKQDFRVYDGTRLLKEKTDYTVTYKNNTNAYTYEGDRSAFIPVKGDKTPYILITGKGNYSGKTYIPFSITQIDLNDAERVFIEESITLKQTSKVQRPLPVITYNAKTVNAKEYTLTYFDSEGNILDKKTGPKAAGTYMIRIEGNSKNFTGTKDVSLTITDETVKAKTAALSKAITVTAVPEEYDGEEHTGAVIASKDGYELTEGKDYTVAYTKNVSAGTATVTATGKGIYTGTVRKTFKITPRLYAEHEDEFDIDVKDAVYSKGGAIPELHVFWNGNELKAGTDYTLKYANNKAVTTPDTSKRPAVTVTFKGNFKGTAVPEDFDILSKDIGTVNITAKDLVYKKGRYQSTPVLTDTDGKKLKAGTDYEKTYEYTGDIIDGDAQPETEITVTVTGKGNYTGTVSTTYHILEAGRDISKATFKIANQEYTGNEIEITDMSQFTETNGLKNAYITVNKQKEYLVLGEHFEVVPGSYVKNINKGTAKVTFRGINGYGGTKTVTFKIVQRSIYDYWQGVKNFFGNLF